MKYTYLFNKCFGQFTFVHILHFAYGFVAAISLFINDLLLDYFDELGCSLSVVLICCKVIVPFFFFFFFGVDSSVA